MTRRTPDDHAEPMTVHEVAAEWLLRGETGRLPPADQARRNAWLDADDAHGAAMEDVSRALEAVREGAADPELMLMREAALKVRPQPASAPPWAIAAAIAAAVVAAAAWGGLPLLRPSSHPRPAAVAESGAMDPRNAVYRTAVGERATVTLPDGSVATLDTDSLMRVAYTGEERGVRLLRGQALFEVAKHRPQPFDVYAGDRRITAVGTKFDVRLDGQGQGARVRVALIEGVVKVTPIAPPHDRAAPPPVVTMAAGELLVAHAGNPVSVTPTDTERLSSWRSGVLTFDDVPLAEAAAEMNRYTTRPIQLTDPAVARLRISGVFKTGDPEHFAETVAEALPVRVDHTGDGAPELVLRR